MDAVRDCKSLLQRNREALARIAQEARAEDEGQLSWCSELLRLGALMRPYAARLSSVMAGSRVLN